MTASVKTNGIWIDSASVRKPVGKIKIPSGELDYVYYDLVASANASTRVGVFVDDMDTPIDEYTTTSHVFERMGKSVTHEFSYPSANKTAGIHKVVIKTGTKSGSNPTVWLWTSPDFEIIIPISDDGV